MLTINTVQANADSTEGFNALLVFSPIGPGTVVCVKLMDDVE